jgi:hypothetical protein
MPSGEEGGDVGNVAPGNDWKNQPSSGKKKHQRRDGQPKPFVPRGKRGLKASVMH